MANKPCKLRTLAALAPEGVVEAVALAEEPVTVAVLEALTLLVGKDDPACLTSNCVMASTCRRRVE